MHYSQRVADILGQVIELLRELDRLAECQPSHRLDRIEPLTVRLEKIRADLLSDNRLLPAIRKTNELMSRLLGGVGGLTDPKYRSTLAAVLGSYQRSGQPAKARLGGLRGGRPRKDGKPTQTLERKGYTAETLPAVKSDGKRVHPKYKPARNAAE